MKRFSNSLWLALGLLALLLIFGVFYYFKNGGLNSSARSANSSEENQIDTAGMMQKEGLVLSDADYVIQQTEKPDLLLLGKSYKTKYTSLSTLVAGTSRPVLEFINANQLMLKGSIMSVYDQVPNEDGDMEIFVGIPVNKRVNTSEFEYKTIKGGKFHKATINSEMGKAAKIWKVVTDQLVKNGQKITFPIFEYPSDSRNSEMTTVISQSNLLIPVK
jgi:predicted transcriptional regulator YdeE